MLQVIAAITLAIIALAMIVFFGSAEAARLHRRCHDEFDEEEMLR